MKFTIAPIALIAAATVVSAETNAHRLARGLAPNPPARRATPVERARRGSPSGTSGGGGSCNTGSIQCCNSMQTTGNSDSFDSFLTSLGLSIPIGTNVGMSCSPISGVGLGSGASCSQQPVCCEDNTYNGLINIGCSPVNVNL